MHSSSLKSKTVAQVVMSATNKGHTQSHTHIEAYLAPIRNECTHLCTYTHIMQDLRSSVQGGTSQILDLTIRTLPRQQRQQLAQLAVCPAGDQKNNKANVTGPIGCVSRKRTKQGRKERKNLAKLAVCPAGERNNKRNKDKVSSQPNWLCPAGELSKRRSTHKEENEQRRGLSTSYTDAGNLSILGCM